MWSGPTPASGSLVGELTPEAVDDLKEFFACIEELRSAQFLQKGLGFKWKITFQTGDRPRNPEPLPEESHLREFLLLVAVPPPRGADLLQPDPRHIGTPPEPPIHTLAPKKPEQGIFR